MTRLAARSPVMAKPRRRSLPWLGFLRFVRKHSQHVLHLPHYFAVGVPAARLERPNWGSR